MVDTLKRCQLKLTKLKKFKVLILTCLFCYVVKQTCNKRFFFIRTVALCKLNGTFRNAERMVLTVFGKAAF